MYEAIYVRQSVEKQDSLSIEGQVELCKKQVTGECRVFEDKGFSGKNINRPAFERLMDEVRSGNVSRLICYRLDRISRSILDFAEVWGELNRYGVEFVSVNEKFDTNTPMGRAMLYIVMIFAQLERETIAERVKDNYYQRVKGGGWGGGRAPFGTKIAQNRKNGFKVLEPSEQADIVKQMFEWYATPGETLSGISKKLQEAGVAPPGKAKAWTNVPVNRILRNPVYAAMTADCYTYYKAKGAIIGADVSLFTGEYCATITGKRSANDRKHRDITNHIISLCPWDPIVDGETFIRCQLKLDGNRQIKNTGKGQYTWLSGLLRCAECGSSIRVSVWMGKANPQPVKYLHCSGHQYYRICDCKRFMQLEEVEAYAEKVLSLVTKGQKATKSKPVDRAKENALKIQAATLDDKINNLVAALADGAGPAATKRINQQIEELEKQAQEVQKQLAAMAGGEASKPVVANFESLSFDEKKAVATAYIEAVNVSEHSASVVLK